MLVNIWSKSSQINNKIEMFYEFEPRVTIRNPMNNKHTIVFFDVSTFPLRFPRFIPVHLRHCQTLSENLAFLITPTHRISTVGAGQNKREMQGHIMILQVLV